MQISADSFSFRQTIPRFSSDSNNADGSGFALLQAKAQAKEQTG